MRTSKERKTAAEAVWTAVLAAAGSNVLAEGTVRWSFLLLAPAFFFLFYRIGKWYKQTERQRFPDMKALLAVSAAFGVLTVVGSAYRDSDSWSGLWNSRTAMQDTALKMFGMAVLAFYAAQAVILLYRRYPVKQGSGRKRFLFWWLVFAAVWLPYLIINYPGHIMGDTCSQIPMAFNMPNKFSMGVIRLSEDVLLTNHHPVLHTMMLGGCIRLGRLLFGGDSAGLFIYTVIQYLIVTCIYGYAVSWLESRKAPPLLVWITALIWLIVPNFPEYAILATKDGLFSSFLLLYGVRTASLLTMPKGTVRNRDLVSLLLCAILCMLMRNNGFYIIFLSMPFLAIAVQGARKRLLLMTVLVLVLHMGYTKVLLPAFDITPGNVRELLSVPLQQTARYFVMFPDEVTQEEREIFDRVIKLEDLEESYTPTKADGVKSRYRKEATKEDLKEFFRMWLSILGRHPGSCIQATLCSLDGYYSFQETSKWNYKITSSEKQVQRLEEESGFKIEYPERFRGISHWVAWKIKQLTENDPLIYLLMQAALYNWILVFILWLSLTRKCFKVMALFMAPAVALLTALAGPMNAATYYRYEFPVSLVLPFLIAVLICFGRSFGSEG